MKVVLVMVATLNGKITSGEDANIYTWTSRQDQDFFFDFLQKHSLIVMGSSTYASAKENIQLDGKRKRIILTRDPEKYRQQAVPGQLEFTNEPVEVLVSRLEDEGYDRMLLVGGGKTNKLFFEKNLVDEMYVTLEPLIFGRGKPLVAEDDFFCKLRLQNMKPLNKQGTLLLHYIVLKEK